MGVINVETSIQCNYDTYRHDVHINLALLEFKHDHIYKLKK
jgi:hypothetical protein